MERGLKTDCIQTCKDNGIDKDMGILNERCLGVITEIGMLKIDSCTEEHDTLAGDSLVLFSTRGISSESPLEPTT